MSKIKGKIGGYKDAAYYTTLSQVYKEHQRGKNACASLLSGLMEGKINNESLNDLNGYLNHNRKEMTKEFNQKCLDLIISLKKGKIPDRFSETLDFIDNEIRLAEQNDVKTTNRMFKKE